MSGVNEEAGNMKRHEHTDDGGGGGGGKSSNRGGTRLAIIYSTQYTGMVLRAFACTYIFACGNSCSLV